MLLKEKKKKEAILKQFWNSFVFIKLSKHKQMILCIVLLL